jgi:hypothetical protein
LVTGGLVTVAVLLVMRGARVPAPRGTRGAVVAGAAGGFMNSAAGVGGPPISLYAVNAGWTVREFVPNARFYSVIVNAFSSRRGERRPGAERDAMGVGEWRDGLVECLGRLDVDLDRVRHTVRAALPLVPGLVVRSDP